MVKAGRGTAVKTITSELDIRKGNRVDMSRSAPLKAQGLMDPGEWPHDCGKLSGTAGDVIHTRLNLFETGVLFCIKQ